MLIAGSCTQELVALKELHKTFEMTDLGNANHILGMRILRDKVRELSTCLRKSTLGRC